MLYTFRRLLDRIEAKIKRIQFFDKSCGRAQYPRTHPLFFILIFFCNLDILRIMVEIQNKTPIKTMPIIDIRRYPDIENRKTVPFR